MNTGKINWVVTSLQCGSGVTYPTSVIPTMALHHSAKFDVFLTVHRSVELFQLPTYAQFIYSVIIYTVLHYNPRL